MNAGDVFRIVGKADRHARIIISDPSRFPDDVVFVNMTSWKPLEDQTCVLTPGDHSTVQHKTCILYSRAVSAKDADLNKLVAGRRLELYEPLSRAVLERVRIGAIRSTRIPMKFKKILMDQGFFPPP